MQRLMPKQDIDTDCCSFIPNSKEYNVNVVAKVLGFHFGFVRVCV